MRFSSAACRLLACLCLTDAFSPPTTAPLTPGSSASAAASAAASVAFVPPLSSGRRRRRSALHGMFDFDFAGGDSSSSDDGEGEEFVPREGQGPNWIEKSSPSGLGPLSPKGESSVESSAEGGAPTAGGGTKVDDYSLGIAGKSFDTGPLSLRMYTALASVALKRFPPNTTLNDLPDELKSVYKLYAMDMTAKEAVKAALKQNGLQMATGGASEEGTAEEDLGAWGELEGLHLVDKSSGERIPGAAFDTVEEAVELGLWKPGQPFDFVARGVPAKVKEMDLSELLRALDPDGNLREEVKEGGGSMPDEEVDSLKALGNECERRANAAPREAEDESAVFRGGPERGYRAMHRIDLMRGERNDDGTEKRSTLMHLMDALVTHGCLIVDLTDGGANFAPALALSDMWSSTSSFFDAVNPSPEGEDVAPSLPSIDVAEGAGSRHATVGFASYGDGRMQFLETRIRRVDGAVIPPEVGAVAGDAGDVDAKMKRAFDYIAEVGKDATRIAVAAVSAEEMTFLERAPAPSGGPFSDMPFISGLTFEEAEVSGVSEDNREESEHAAQIKAAEAASLLADELIDDGRIPPPGSPSNPDESTISMSPHRMCRYAEPSPGADSSTTAKLSEIFGAHTDTSFITAVPVASVSGLEVYDETEERWYRPELAARDHWERERAENLQDFKAQTEVVNVEGAGEVELPWHSRYVVLMPGELMQLATRGEVPAAVHRVVAVTGGAARMSAPVLLRARNGMKMDVGRYLGKGGSDLAEELLEECDGMAMEDIHDAMQPSSFR
mmetsp:Transcript_21534/g.63087  ORF Transcript_21534/g.63087 Transcript_21534/m.63087 type:complete len:784 (-) Transcript_21534:127-2478(-)